MRVPTNSYQEALKFLIKELSIFEKKNQKIDNTIVKNLGGLYIIGTERNDSRRIDNQLRGRCARQGDPGTSQILFKFRGSTFTIIWWSENARIYEESVFR